MKLPKSNRSTKKYTSPYLEPLPQPHHPWTNVKEVMFHNMKVKKQRMQNKMKVIQMQQQYEKEVNNNHHTLRTVKNIEVMVNTKNYTYQIFNQIPCFIIFPVFPLL